MVNQAHHHRGQNRLHHKTITHPHAPPPEMPEPNNHFLCGSEGLIGPPLPCVDHKHILVVEHLLYDRQN